MKQKRKRSRVLALLALLCLGVGCGVPPAQESGEESRIAPAEDSRPAAVEEWKGPEIIHCRIPENSDKRLEIEVALYTLGLRYIQTRSGAEALEKYGYRILKIGEYQFKDAVRTEDGGYGASDPLFEREIPRKPDYWLVTYMADAQFEGRLPNGKVMPEKDETTLWNLDQKKWVVYGKDGLYSMMSCADYREFLRQNGQDAQPFAAAERELADVPLTEGVWNRDRRILERPEGTFYFEPLQSWLCKEARYYSCKADPEPGADAALRKAAEEMGRLYMEELCGTPYEEGLDEGYRFSAFKELKVTCIEPEADTWTVRYEAWVQTEGGNGQWQIQPDFFRDHTALVGCSGTEYYMALQKDIVAFHSIWDVWAGCLEEGIVVRARVRGFENRPRPI